MLEDLDRKPYRGHISAAITVVSNRQGKRHIVVKQYLLRAIARYARTIETEKNGIRYFLDTGDEGVGLRVFIDGSYEEDQMDEIVQLVESETGRTLSGSTFIDIGANIGTTTALAAKKFGAAQVVAFEPEPRNYELLQMVILANALDDRVKTYRVALSNSEGAATLELSGMNAGDHRVRVGSPGVGALGEEKWQTTSIRTARLDDFDINFRDVSLVWMDVQGHEGHVLAGASRLLAAKVPVVAEYDPYMLGRAGGLELFHSIAEANFRTVIDVRESSRLPSTDVRTLGSIYDQPGYYTDLLLLP